MSAPPTAGGALITTALRPHLCIDTCSVLDIMRDITRKDANAKDRRAALELLDAIRAGKVVSCIAEQVEDEFQEHVDSIEEDASRALERLRTQFATANELVGLFDTPVTVTLAHFDGHANRARKVAEEWMTLATLITQSPTVASLAFARVRGNIAPATKGKQSVKDCAVIETYLEYVKSLRANGDQAKVVFLSSNRADYCEGESGLTLRAPLDAEFAALQMEFWPNFGAAKHALDI